MPAVARGNSRDTVTTNHGCASTTTTQACSSNVIINGIGVHRDTDLNTTHTIPCGSSCCPHTRPIVVASSNVIANGLGVARVGDPYSGCGQVATGSSNVAANSNVASLADIFDALAVQGLGV